jgi:hypothetical protein
VLVIIGDIELISAAVTESIISISLADVPLIKISFD